jgi:hypothetical protein
VYTTQRGAQVPAAACACFVIACGVIIVKGIVCAFVTTQLDVVVALTGPRHVCFVQGIRPAIQEVIKRPPFLIAPTSSSVLQSS